MPSSSKWLPYARPVRSPKVTVHSLPARPQHVVNGVRARGRLVAVVHRAEVSDPRAADFAGELGAEHGLHDAARVNEAVGRVELLESLEEERSLLGIEQGEPLVQGHLADVRLDL